LQIDQLPEELRAKAIKKATKLLHQTLALTKFGKAAVIPVAAKPGVCVCVCVCVCHARASTSTTPAALQEHMAAWHCGTRSTLPAAAAAL
jgi:tRNA A37 threonylcarbamoyltransferase TsaD